MSWPFSRRALLGLALSLAAAARLGAAWNARVYQRIHKDGLTRTADYGFLNFNDDFLQVSYKISEKDFRKYNDAFGYKDQDVKALQRWRDAGRLKAYEQARQTGESQARYDAAVADINQTYDRKLRAYLGWRGFVLDPGNVVRADLPRLVRLSKAYLRPVAAEIDRYGARQDYGTRQIVGAALSMVQTAVVYREPKVVYKDKETGGLLLPLTSLMLGWGDCDTKTGLLASMLDNWPGIRMVGLSVPGHYLLAVLAIPYSGDRYIEYNGLQYVLLEPAGPAWIPIGQVADTTLAELDAPEGYRIDPFF